MPDLIGQTLLNCYRETKALVREGNIEVSIYDGMDTKDTILFVLHRGY